MNYAKLLIRCFYVFFCSMSSALRILLEKNTLVGKNYDDWLRNIKLVFSLEKISYVLTDRTPKEPVEGASQEEVDDYRVLAQDFEQGRCFLLASMSNELQRRHEKMDVESILLHLKELYQKRPRALRYGVSCKLFDMKMVAGQSVEAHVLNMIGYIEEMEEMGLGLHHVLYIDIILKSLTPTFIPFIDNMMMNELEPELPNLLSLLREFEETRSKKTPALVLDSSSSKPKGKGKSKSLGPKKVVKKGKGKGKPLQGKKGKMAEAECFFCHKKGHWKRNCASFLADKKKHGNASSSGILVTTNIILSITSIAWVLDTEAGSHICNMLQGLRSRRELKNEEVVLQVGNKASVAAGAVGDFHHTLASGAKMILRNCYFISNFLCNVISVSSLARDGFVFVIKGNVMNIFLMIYCKVLEF